MATLNIAQPAVLQFPQSTAVEPITQLRLALVLSLRNRVRQVQAELDKQETELRTMIESGAAVEAGERTVAIEVHTRRNVHWKAISQRLAKRLGYDPLAYVSNVLAHTRPTKTVSVAIN